MPPRSSSEPTAAQRLASCERCAGSGYLLDPIEPVARRCDCGLLEAVEADRRLAAAAIPPRFRSKTFDGFKSARDAKLRGAVDYCRSYAENFAHGDYDGFLMRGVPGCGKTHLAIATLRMVIQRGFTGRFENFGDLLGRIRESYGDATAGSEYALLSLVSDADLLVLDDLGAESMTEWVRDRLYLIVNKRYELSRPIIVTTNLDEGALTERIGLRVASRLAEMCLAGPDFPAVDFRMQSMR